MKKNTSKIWIAESKSQILGHKQHAVYRSSFHDMYECINTSYMHAMIVSAGSALALFYVRQPT